MSPIKVLIVDDSVFIRVSISRLLDSDPDIKVVGVAKDGREALEKIKTLRPDVVTLDVIMPVMDGLSALKEIMKTRPTPVVMLSSITRRGARETIAALAYGAIDFIPKPLDVTSPSAISHIKEELIAKVKVAAVSKVEAASSEVTAEHLRRAMRAPADLFSPPVSRGDQGRLAGESIIAIGASTGGPSALQIVLAGLPENFPLGLIIIQHISTGFTEALVERLDKFCHIKVAIARNNELIEAGKAYFAPAGSNLRIEKTGTAFQVRLSEDPTFTSIRPSIDVAFQSIARCAADCCGILLTGMGVDGAAGIKEIRESGGLAIVQNEATSVIFGMARRAVEMGGVDKVLPLNKITDEINGFAGERLRRLDKAV